MTHSHAHTLTCTSLRAEQRCTLTSSALAPSLFPLEDSYETGPGSPALLGLATGITGSTVSTALVGPAPGLDLVSGLQGHDWTKVFGWCCWFLVDLMEFVDTCRRAVPGLEQ